MGLFGFGKEGKVIDLSEKYNREQERIKQEKALREKEASKPKTFFASLVENAKKQNEKMDREKDLNDKEENTYSDVHEDKKQKLGKRLVEIETRLENISNQVYHLQQRVELLEKKAGVRIES
jgi:hypothetical protein